MTGGHALSRHSSSRGKDFRPATRGDIRKALAERNGMTDIAPQSPRPTQMLASLLAGPGEALTHDDIKLYELLVSLAYADDGEMPDTYATVDMQEIIKYLGNRTRREDIRRAFRRLKQTELAFRAHHAERIYEGVSLIHGWHRIEGDEDVVEYQLPAPIREALAAKSQYAYVELAALPPMRSKYSIALYRRLAAMTDGKRWMPGGSNRMSTTYTPSRLAEVIGFPVGPDGKVHGGKLRKHVLDRIMPQFDEDTGERLPGDFDAVKNFSVDVTVVDNPKRRGRPIEKIEFTVTLAMPQLRHDRWIDYRRKPEPGDPRIGAADCPQYRVSASVWRRAYRAYRKHLHLGAREMHELWIIALDEAIEGLKLTSERHRRQFRGARLLDVIERKGADEAAWLFITEEADYPDLTPCERHDYPEHKERYAAADRRRRARVDWDEIRASKKKARKERLAKEAAASEPAAPPAPVRRPPPPRPAFLDRPRIREDRAAELVIPPAPTRPASFALGDDDCPF